MSDTRTGEVGHPAGVRAPAAPGLSAYGQDDPADVPGGVGYALSMVETARYWIRRSAGGGRPDLQAEVAEARNARRLAEILDRLGEISSPLAPLEVLEVGATSTWTATALGRLGFRVESTADDAASVRRSHLFDLVLAAVPPPPEGVLNLASLVRLGGRLLLSAGSPEDLRPLLEPRGFRLHLDNDAETGPGALLAWTRES